MSQPQKSQAGFAHMAIIIVIVLVASVGGAGYYVFTKNKDKKSDSTSSIVASADTKAVSDACNKALNDKDFCKFASNFKALTNYKAVITGTGADSNSSIVLEVENNDNSRMVISQNGKETSSFVTIGKDSYYKDLSDGKWVKSTDTSTTTKSESNIHDSIKVEDFSAAETAKTEYKKIGKEPCGKLTCFKYQIIEKDTPNVEQFVWFDTKDYLMRRFTTKDNGETSDMSFTYEKVKITAPSPVKTTTDTSVNGMPSQEQIDAAMKAAEALNASSSDN